MVNQQLLDYIKQRAQQGKTREEIKQELLGVGWSEADVKEALDGAGSGQAFSPSMPLPSIQPQISTLPGIRNLFKRTLAVYKEGLGTFLGIMVISLIPGLLFLVPEIVLEKSGSWNTFLFIIFWLIAAFIGFWAQVSLIFAIKDREEKIGIGESFRRGWHKIISLVWVGILVGFITMGGYMLLIVPGIIFAIWFTFSTYVLVSEDRRGMNALFRSKQLVAGYWWKVLWRFSVIGLLIFLFYLALFGIIIIFLSLPLANWVQSAINIIPTLFITPFSFAFGFLLYEDLKKQKAQVVFEPPKRGTKIKFVLIGILGFLLILAILASIIFVSLGGPREKAQEANIMGTMSQLGMAMEFYSMDNNYSFNGADCSLPEFASVCSNIKEYTGEMPTIKSSAEDYCFYVSLPSGEYSCYSRSSLGVKTTIFPGGPGYCDGTTFNCP